MKSALIITDLRAKTLGDPKFLTSFWNSPVIIDSRAKTLGDLKIRLSRHILLEIRLSPPTPGENAWGHKKILSKNHILKDHLSSPARVQLSLGTKKTSFKKSIITKHHLSSQMRGRKRLGIKNSFQSSYIMKPICQERLGASNSWGSKNHFKISITEESAVRSPPLCKIPPPSCNYYPKSRFKGGGLGSPKKGQNLASNNGEIALQLVFFEKRKVIPPLCKIPPPYLQLVLFAKD